MGLGLPLEAGVLLYGFVMGAHPAHRAPARRAGGQGVPWGRAFFMFWANGSRCRVHLPPL